ncbi:MAG: YihY/virulence factor BrkB family protein [Thermoleophilia bacterium]|nr:YihY/virulence factor BrkB family protein [Thermoleophilia bacterium]
MAVDADPGAAAPADASARPPDPGRRRWWQALRGAVRAFRDDDATDRAASLTFYGILSLFPGAIALFSLLGVFGSYPETADALLSIVGDLAPSAVDALTEPIGDVTRAAGTAGAFLGIGTLAAIWAASGYVGAFARASSAIHGVEEGRPLWSMRLRQLLVTVVLLVMAALVAIGLVVSGSLAAAVGDAIGAGATAVHAWSVAKWPALVLIVIVMLAILFSWAPGPDAKGFRWITPGSAFAVLVVIVASAGFEVYVANLGSYSATYGSLGGVIVFLLWLWIANCGLLLGLELDAELDAARAGAGRGG